MNWLRYLKVSTLETTRSGSHEYRNIASVNGILGIVDLSNGGCSVHLDVGWPKPVPGPSRNTCSRAFTGSKGAIASRESM